MILIYFLQVQGKDYVLGWESQLGEGTGVLRKLHLEDLVIQCLPNLGL